MELKVEAEGVLIRSVHLRLSLVDQLQVYRPMDSESGHIGRVSIPSDDCRKGLITSRQVNWRPLTISSQARAASTGGRCREILD